MTFPSFESDNLSLAAKFQEACKGLILNIAKLGSSASRETVLIEGGGYPGIWLECGPREGVVYGTYFDTALATANHRIFFNHQRQDGQLPCWITKEHIGFGQIQMVEPIAQTAWETYQLTHNRDFLLQAYESGSRFDDWLGRHRDSQGLGLVELFCEFDTGHDNSGRFSAFCPDLPKACPEDEARNCPTLDGLPWLAPDLSSNRFGSRTALAQIARELGRTDEATAWDKKAEQTRLSIFRYLYDEKELCFFDREKNGNFHRIVCDILFRVLAEGLVEQTLFDAIFERYIQNPSAFWTTYPFPSVSISDSHFDPSMRPNCWGGPSQGLTALRAPRWMSHYGRHTELFHLMSTWIKALCQAPFFFQQMNPFTGASIKNDWIGQACHENNYTPSMLAFVDFVARSHGIRPVPGGIEWACHAPPDSLVSRFSSPQFSAALELRPDRSVLERDGEAFAIVFGQCRVLTDHHGRPLRITNLADGRQPIRFIDATSSNVVFDQCLDKNVSVACASLNP